MKDEILTQFEEEVLDAVYEINLARGTATHGNIKEKIASARIASGTKTPLQVTVGGLCRIFNITKDQRSTLEHTIRSPSSNWLRLTLDHLEEAEFLRSRTVEMEPSPEDKLYYEELKLRHEEIRKKVAEIEQRLKSSGFEEIDDDYPRLENTYAGRPTIKEYFLTTPGKRRPTPKDAASPSSPLIPAM